MDKNYIKERIKRYHQTDSESAKEHLLYIIASNADLFKLDLDIGNLTEKQKAETLEWIEQFELEEQFEVTKEGYESIKAEEYEKGLKGSGLIEEPIDLEFI